ncbi:hypothetical protein, partial [Paenibacillus germinis]|uniref:hypothetical protein n=1 Tax=Paenibacillus germinis TaxID=2654979 RepID=UPI0014913373
GNPNAIISFNPGVSIKKNPQAGDFEDYTAGEVTSFGAVPTSRWLDGLQWHTLSHLGTGWAGANKSYTDMYMVDYIKSVNQNQGVVSMDAAIFKNGSLSPDQLNQMKAIKAGVRDGINPSPPDENNVAFGIVPSASANFNNLVKITNGDKDTNQFSDSYPNNGLRWIKIDLG